MKTIFVGFIAILMAMFVLGGTVSAAITALPGDYNVDGRVTESDLTAYKQDKLQCKTTLNVTHHW